MLAIVGTVPDADFPVVAGPVHLEDNSISVDNRRVPVNRGTPALLASSILAGQILGLPEPFCFLAGDIGLGNGSRQLYEYLCKNLPDMDFKTMTFHYLQPDVDWHNKVLFTIQAMKNRTILIADAGFMYAAKMSGQAPEYDLFTPDAGEMAFLADEEAPHPFYTRGFILHEQNKVPDLISRAYRCQNAASCLLVKGQKDYIADQDGSYDIIDAPMVESLEAIGGTGDTLTGIVSALISSGMETKRAASLAARINRLAGSYANPTPATQVLEIIMHIPKAMEWVLEESDA